MRKERFLGRRKILREYHVKVLVTWRGTKKEQWGERFKWGGWKGRAEEGVG